MRFFSRDSLTQRQSLGEICDPEGGFAQNIDRDLVALAEGNPRAVIYLADQLLRLHCQVEDPPWLIEPETWEQVKVEWGLRGRAQIFGLDKGQGFRQCGDRIFLREQEVVLSARYHELLHYLVGADGRVCSREELARAGWPGEDPRGVSDRAVTESVRRMKSDLEEQGIDPDWVETVHGRGYRIRQPADKDAPVLANNKVGGDNGQAD
jgi:DNA-binding winged helix-turn-helix (wHTH) protein